MLRPRRIASQFGVWTMTTDGLLTGGDSHRVDRRLQRIRPGALRLPLGVAPNVSTTEQSDASSILE